VAKNTPAPAVDTEVEPAVGKGHATPTRKEREEARKRPLVSTDRAAARRQDSAQRERQRIGMANGDEKFLPARDRGPQKRFVRDYVDARWSIGEGMIPILVVVIILTFFKNATLQTTGLILMYAFLIAVVADSLLLGRRITKQLQAKYGDKTEKVRWYATMRAVQLRPLRMPKPQVKRGQTPKI
jgi:hypothetical protein